MIIHRRHRGTQLSLKVKPHTEEQFFLAKGLVPKIVMPAFGQGNFIPSPKKLYTPPCCPLKISLLLK
jgi:hypothetical protein